MAGTRERILETAEVLLEEEGLMSLTLNRILQRSGVSKGAFFHHFKNKEELVREILDVSLEGLRSDKRRLMAEGHSEAEAQIQVTIDRLRNRRASASALVAAVAIDPKLGPVVCAFFREQILALTQAGLATDDAHVMLFALQGLFVGSLLRMDYADGEIEHVVRKLREIAGRSSPGSSGR